MITFWLSPNHNTSTIGTSNMRCLWAGHLALWSGLDCRLCLQIINIRFGDIRYSFPKAYSWEQGELRVQHSDSGMFNCCLQILTRKMSFSETSAYFLGGRNGYRFLQTHRRMQFEWNTIPWISPWSYKPSRSEELCIEYLQWAATCPQWAATSTGSFSREAYLHFLGSRTFGSVVLVARWLTASANLDYRRKAEWS
jgi:hypothetical protein